MNTLREGLEGKSVIVTGAACGMGMATALLLGECGCAVTLADVNEAGGRETVARITEKKGSRAQFVRTDVSDEASVAKAGVDGLVRGAAVDYATSNIRINALHPGSMDTPMNTTATSTGENLNELIKRIPMRRMSNPAEVAEAALWLISDQASYVTGASFLADGGLSIS